MMSVDSFYHSSSATLTSSRSHLNHRLRVTLTDTRQITGYLLAFDVHMNLVLSDSDEFRRTKQSKQKQATSAAPPVEEKRSLGLIILRGEWICSVSVEGPPPADPRDRLGTAKAGPGVGKAVGRGVAIGNGGALPLGSGEIGALGGPISRSGPGNFAPPNAGR